LSEKKAIELVKEPELRWEVGNGITLCRRCHRKPLHPLMREPDNLFQIIELGL